MAAASRAFECRRPRRRASSGGSGTRRSTAGPSRRAAAAPRRGVGGHRGGRAGRGGGGESVPPRRRAPAAGGGAEPRQFEFKGFPDAVAFVNRVAGAADAADHHPDIDIRYNKVRLTLSTHSEGGITAKDLELAARADELAP